MVQEGGNTYLPIYDGSGNVHGMIQANTGGGHTAGDTVATYEYDAFGRTLRESGDFAALNPFQYSTKYTDTETGLVYYGLRYYSPSLGRFLNKDPIEEQGGLNLYSFCGNNGVNAWDYLGMSGHYEWKPNHDGGAHPAGNDGNNYSNDSGHYEWVEDDNGGQAIHESVDLQGNGDPFDNLHRSGDPQGITQTVGLYDAATGSTLNIYIHNASSADIYQANQAMFNTVANFDYSQNTVAPNSAVTLQRVGDGVGDVTQRTYVANFNTTQSPTAIISNMAGNINSYTANRVNPWYESPFTPTQTRPGSDPIFVGNVLKIDGPLLFNPQVQVTARTDTSFTFTTVVGHPEAGTITFSANQVASGRVSFTIDSVMQPSSSFNNFLYGIPGIGGKAIQTEIWNGTLQNVITNSGGSNGVILNRTINLGPPGGG